MPTQGGSDGSVGEARKEVHQGAKEDVTVAERLFARTWLQLEENIARALRCNVEGFKKNNNRCFV